MGVSFRVKALQHFGIWYAEVFRTMQIYLTIYFKRIDFGVMIRAQFNKTQVATPRYPSELLRLI